MSDRLFWPAVVFATLALGGFGYFAATKMFRPVPNSHLTFAPLDKPSRASVPKTENAPPGAATAEPTPAQVEAALAAVPDAPDPTAEAAPEAEMAAATAKAMEPDDPYVVPDHKPFINQQTFARPAPPRPAAKRPAAKVDSKAAPKTVAAAKPMVPTAVKTPAMSEVKIPGIPSARYPTYVLNDGRRIAAAKVVDLGEFWGLKTTTGQIVSVRKEDVKEVAR